MEPVRASDARSGSANVTVFLPRHPFTYMENKTLYNGSVLFEWYGYSPCKELKWETDLDYL